MRTTRSATPPRRTCARSGTAPATRRSATRWSPTSRRKPAPIADCGGASEMRLPNTSAIVAVVIPCLNEQEPIGEVVREVLAQGADEVIVVDNGSPDATAQRARDEIGRAAGRER